MPKLAMHWWILIGLVAGVAYGYVAALTGHTAHVLDYIAPIALYLGTTAVAIAIGLLVVNLFGPGKGLSVETREKLLAAYGDAATQKAASAAQVSIVDQLVNIVPTNPFGALADAQMLQVVFFALMLGIALTRLSRRVEGTAHVIKVFQLLSDAIIEMVQLIMKIAPLGVFAMLAAVVADLGKDPGALGDLLSSLGGYMATVVIALLVHYLVVYSVLLKVFTKVPWSRFAKAMIPAQLLAFSSSSSAATLPVTIRCVELAECANRCNRAAFRSTAVLWTWTGDPGGALGAVPRRRCCIAWCSVSGARSCGRSKRANGRCRGCRDRAAAAASGGLVGQGLGDVLRTFCVREVEGFLRCGVLGFGFARVYCGACGESDVVALPRPSSCGLLRKPGAADTATCLRQVLVQGPWLLSVVWHAAHGRNSGVAGRPCDSGGAGSAVGAVDAASGAAAVRV